MWCEGGGVWEGMRCVGGVEGCDCVVGGVEVSVGGVVCGKE